MVRSGEVGGQMGRARAMIRCGEVGGQMGPIFSSGHVPASGIRPLSIREGASRGAEAGGAWGQQGSEFTSLSSLRAPC